MIEPAPDSFATTHPVDLALWRPDAAEETSVRGSGIKPAAMLILIGTSVAMWAMIAYAARLF